MTPGRSRRAVVATAATVATGLLVGCAGSRTPARAAGDGCTAARVLEVEWHYTLPLEDQDKVVVTVSNPAAVGGTVVVEFRYYPRLDREGTPMKREAIAAGVGADDAVRLTHRLFPPAGGGHRSLGAAVVEQDCRGRAARTDPAAGPVRAPGR